MKLRYTQASLRQIEEAFGYIEVESPQGASGLRERILRAADLLLAYPYAGKTTDRRGVGRLVLTPFPYVIFYSITASEIVISRFRHAARKSVRQ